MDGRNSMSLRGSWKLALDPTNVGRQERWFEAIADGAQDAPVPGIIQQVYPGYHGVAWYWLSFPPEIVPAPQQRCLLRFSAVDYLAEVWLNGQPLGGHEGGETPFALDAASALIPGRPNLLAVRVLNPTVQPIDGIALDQTPHRNKVVPYRIGASFNQGGIVAPVDLEVVPLVRITDVFARPEADSGLVRLEVATRNDAAQAARARLAVAIGPAAGSAWTVLASYDDAWDVPPGEHVYHLALRVAQPHLWDLDDPYLYRASVRLESEPGGARSEFDARFGFRTLSVQRGYFRLNGRRIFLRSTHTGNHYPIGQQVPVHPDFLRRDLINAKASGFNMVRFIAGVPYPEQLDFCDELGLMVYEECYAAWCLADSPQMGERFDRATAEMILRDRNHPSVTIWGLLNETVDGPVFRRAVAFLPKLRALDDTRLVLLGSGRWDCQWSIGSVSNPGSMAWEHVWGAEAPGAPAAPSSWTLGYPGGYFQQAGDAHVYPRTPQAPETNRFIRALGHGALGEGTKPVFLSEYGIGSLFHVLRETRHFEQARARAQGTWPAPAPTCEWEDEALMRSMADRLTADWERCGMTGTYAFVEDMLRDSQRLHARQRLLGFDLIRSNPQICGYNLTGMLDHGMTGEGLWTFFREWKPGIVDALADGWAPLRWCIFVEPLYGYVGRPVTVEAVLANEDVLPPGEYPCRFRVFGPRGMAWERAIVLHIPAPALGEDGPLALPALHEEITLDGPAGDYEFVALMEAGGAPAGGRLAFRLADPAPLRIAGPQARSSDHPDPAGRTGATPPPTVGAPIALWGVEPHVRDWLAARGVATAEWTGPGSDPRIVLVGDPGEDGQDERMWSRLSELMQRGRVVILASPAAVKRGEDPVGWLPLANKGRCYAFNDWLYHKECVAKAHPAFEGLQAPGIMDWDYYGPIIPHELYDGQDTPDEVMAAAFAVSYPLPGGYASGVLMGRYALGAGHLILNTLHILDQVERHPAADRLLLNLLGYAAQLAGAQPG